MEGPVLENVCPSVSNPEDATTVNNEKETDETQSRTSQVDSVKISDQVPEDSAIQTINSENDKVKNIEVANNTQPENEDDEAMIIESEDNPLVDLSEVSTDELLAFDDVTSVAQHADTSTHSTNNDNCNTTKATEFVIVNTTNITSLDCEDVNETSDLQIKDELAETITDDINHNDVLENDPMGLLEPNDRSEITSSNRSQGDPGEFDDDISSSSSIKTGSSSTNVHDWGKYYTWLLYEEDDENNGYCLYCDTNLNIKSHHYIKQHDLSLYHKERCSNYLAFREEEERNGLSTSLVEIKQEFGTDSRVTALKLKRKTQTEALNNFNWRRWLVEHTWLERSSPEGMIGRCKYCGMRVNAEFAYLRERHQESSKHQQNEKNYMEKSNDQHSHTSNNDINEETEEETDDVDSSKKWGEPVKHDPNGIRCKLCDSKMIKTSFAKHLRSNMHMINVKNYLKISKKRRNNSTSSKGEDDSSKINQSWKLSLKKHPWLMADPMDPVFAYCKYCEKRVIYGNSASKRATHENSTHHKTNELSFKERQRKGNKNEGVNQDDEANQKKLVKNNEANNDDDDDGNVTEDEEDEEGDEEENVEDDEEKEEEANEDENEEEEDEEEEDKDEDEEDEDDEEGDDDNEEAENDQDVEEKEENDNDSKKRIYRLSEEWFNQYPWSKKYHKNPSLIYCIYCKIPLSIAYNRAKHQTTALHIAAEAEYLSKQAKKQLSEEKRNEANDDESHEWVVTYKNNINMYSCKYCRVRISSKFCKKNHAKSKIHQINENIYKANRRKSSRQEETTINSSQTSTTVTQPSVNSTPNKVVRYAKVVVKGPSLVTLIKQWQKRFNWLTYKRSELRSHYGYCKICDNSLYIRSLKHVVRHTRSIRHVGSIKSMKKQKVEQEQGSEPKQSTKVVAKGPKEELQASPTPPPSEKAPQKQAELAKKTSNDINYMSTLEEMQKRFSWIEKSSSRQKLAFCRYCNVHIPIKVLSLRNHSNSSLHRQSVINYSKTNKNIDKKQNKNKETSENAGEDDDDDEDDNNEEEDNDVLAVEENTEEILISEQDENWDVKSEIMDEHEELDYLLQRSINNSQNKGNIQRNVRKSLITEEQPAPKRIKRSQSFRRLNESNTSLVASILSTPLTLASCLGPLIQQQIQQATNSQTIAVPASPAQAAAMPVEPENTYDLFFKSISETMKKLPIDLAAEGKVRVMQIICDLELQALKRQQMPVSEIALASNSLIGTNYTLPTTTSTGDSNGVAGGTEQYGQISESVMTPFNTTNTILSPPSSQAIHVTPPPPPPPPSTSSVNSEKTTPATSAMIGLMDKNGLQTLQLKPPSTSKPQAPKSTSTTTITTVSSNNTAGIRCIPFKNLTQTMSGEAGSKYTRIHVPISTPQSTNSNVTQTNTQKGQMINFRNIQITKRTTPQTSCPSPSGVTTLPVGSGHTQQQQQHHQQPTMVNKSPQRTYITNIPAQLQRWGCSVVNGAASNTPISSASINNQFSSKPTSTPNTPISSVSINQRLSSKQTSTPNTPNSSTSIKQQLSSKQTSSSTTKKFK